MELLPYQVKGAAFLASRERAGLFDEMGVGKTAQAIRALDDIGAMRVLIVCPAAVREVWRGEFRKFERTRRRIIKGRDIHDLNLWLKGRSDVLLLSYEMATKWTRRILEQREIIDAIIFDESHYLKNANAARTRALLGHRCDGAGGLVEWGVHTWFLTGTPNPNDAADIWSMMRCCGATTLSQTAFRVRYFTAWAGARSVHHRPRREMLAEIRQAIDSFSLRRTKKGVGLQLPPIWLTTVSVEGNTEEVNALLREHPGLSDEIMEAVEKGGLSFLEAQHIATLRRLVGEAKAPAFLNLLLEELKNGLGKVVVFGIHRRALDHLYDGLQRAGIGVVRLDGGTAERDRVAAVEAFQRDDGPSVFLGNIRAAGTGVTLTAAADVIMFEQDWSPAGNAQALMRVHRIGQEKAIRARFVSLAGSIDEHVAAVVARKTASIAMIQGEAISA